MSKFLLSLCFARIGHVKRHTDSPQCPALYLACTSHPGQTSAVAERTACVTCHDPDSAHELARIMLATRHITRCTFGGEDLRTLFISSASTELSPEQLAFEALAGALFAVEIDSPGLPAACFGA